MLDYDYSGRSLEYTQGTLLSIAVVNFYLSQKEGAKTVGGTVAGGAVLIQ